MKITTHDLIKRLKGQDMLNRDGSELEIKSLFWNGDQLLIEQ